MIDRRLPGRSLLLASVLLWISSSPGAAQPSVSKDPSPPDPAKLLHRQWKTTEGLPHNTVTAIAGDALGYLWLGTVEGLVRFDGEEFTVFDTSTTKELQSNFINALLATEDGGLWIGTRHGLGYHQGGEFRLFTEAHGLAGEVIEDLAMDEAGTLWVGTSTGLSQHENGVFRSFGQEDGLISTTIFALEVDAQGDLWIGAVEGLSRFRNGRFDQLGPEQGLADEFVMSLESAPAGTLWAGTVDGGLHRVDTEAFEATGALLDLTPPLVFSLHHDSRGSLWVGTRTGLARASEKLLKQEPAVGTDLVMSLYEDRDGRLWAGTLQSGLHVLQSSAKSPLRSPPVIIEGIILQQRSFPPKEGLPFPKGRADVVFQYTAIDFESREPARFRHFLEGYDDFWVDASHQRRAAYTNLPPGAYRFRVRGGQGLDDDHEATYSFEIPARYYQTRIFKLLALAAAASLLWALFLWRVRQLLKTRLFLQQRIADQTKEILEQRDQLEHFHQRLDQAHNQLQQTNRELKSRNREKSDFLAIATHDLRAPLVNLKGFAAELRHSLDQVWEILEPALEDLPPDQRESTRRALQEDGPEALRFIEGSAKKMEEVIGPILKMSRLARQPLKIQPVSLKESLDLALAKLERELDSSGAQVEVHSLPGVLADGRALEEIFFQLLANALYSLDPDRAGRIEVRAKKDERSTIVSVRDNGRSPLGPRATRPFQLFGRPRDGGPASPDMGLGFARILVQRHGGKVWFSSNLSIGSTFYFSIPRKPSPISP